MLQNIGCGILSSTWWAIAVPEAERCCSLSRRCRMEHWKLQAAAGLVGSGRLLQNADCGIQSNGWCAISAVGLIGADGAVGCWKTWCRLYFGLRVFDLHAGLPKGASRILTRSKIYVITGN
ncbi:hypothetical protein AXF42_Ash021798 [Apostasia shenzhenica]|uniref:Uncharacterized protein n=1 Tax=Apostasia shenzhenica TaxID=1088818 RepID=A0A2H9ZVY6_9ASPA|nr:hypothetical protein AXF42_Ash021798 [Apostasia shenzhenica]